MMKEGIETIKATIEIKGLTHQFDDQKALSEMDLLLETPKIYGLIGRNGAGKTTLLSLLAGYREVQEGEIKIFGEAVFENSSVTRNVSYHGKPDYEEEDEKVGAYFDFYQRYRPKFDKAYALRIAEVFEIPLDKKINKLSQGKQSALKGILGLASKTPVTIFDEVYLGMDAPSRTRFYKEVLEEQLKEPRLMIISTHLVSEMEYLFDHVLIMHQGKIMIDEPADEILERGFAVTGEKSQVEEFTKDLRVLHREALGQIQKVIIFGEKEKLREEVLERLNIEISEVSLQDLFIHLTEKKRDVDDQRVKGGKYNG